MVGIIPSRGSDQFALRFPDGMRDRIKVRAAENRRSMNSEILGLLEAALGAAENGSGVSSLETANPATENRTSAETLAD